MPFVERDGGGAIVAVYAMRQPGRAEEELTDDNAELAAFGDRDGSPEPDSGAVALALLQSKGMVTRQDIDDEKARQRPAKGASP